MDNHTKNLIFLLFCVIIISRTAINDRIADFSMKLDASPSIEVSASYR